MGIFFKHQSLEALGALQDHEGEGGQGNKNNYTNVSLRLCITIHQYIDAQSHLLHTLSLPFSLSLSIHTYTRTPHTHLHRANQADMS